MDKREVKHPDRTASTGAYSHRVILDGTLLNRPVKTPSVPSLERALAILELIARTRAGLALPEIAEALHLPKSSVHCLLITLERHRYLQRNDKSGRYRFGAGLFKLVRAGAEVRA